MKVAGYKLSALEIEAVLLEVGDHTEILNKQRVVMKGKMKCFILLFNIITICFLQHPAIAECAILGDPDNYFGEVVCAVVVLNNEVKSKSDSKAGQPLTLRQLRAWAKERLAPYKVHVCYLHC